MALTVADVLKLKPFATGKVIAGENGVTRKVEHVSVMEVDITEWFSSELVRGASLEISSMYALVDHPERQVEAEQERSCRACPLLCGNSFKGRLSGAH